MGARWCLAVVLAACVVVASAPRAQADPVAVTSGSVVVHQGGELGSFALFGSDFGAAGATLTGASFTFGPGFTGFEDTITLDSQGGGFVASGGTTFFGTSATDINGPLNVAVGPFSIPAPAPGQTSYMFTAPFTATGSLTTVAGSMFQLSGHGMASLAGGVTGIPGHPSYGNPTELFTFSGGPASPTPEPASLILLGTGLVGFVGRKFATRA